MWPHLIVFDIAGTTVEDHNYVAKAFINSLNEFNIEVSEEEVNPIMGYHKPQAIKMVLEKKRLRISDQLIDSIHTTFQNQMLDFYRLSPEVSALPHAEETFLILKRAGIKVALNTGFSKVIAQSIVDRLQWIENGLIDDFIASDEVIAGRPFPYMIEELIKRQGLQKDAIVIKVGDTPIDILEGKNAKCKLTISVTTGAFSKEDLEKYQPDFIISSLSELPLTFQETKKTYA